MNNTKTASETYAANLVNKSFTLMEALSHHRSALEALAAKADILAIEDYLYNSNFATTEVWDEETLEYLFMVATYTNEDGYTIKISTEDNTIRLNCDNCMYSQGDLSTTLSLMLNAWGRIAMAKEPEYIESMKQHIKST